MADQCMRSLTSSQVTVAMHFRTTQHPARSVLSRQQVQNFQLKSACVVLRRSAVNAVKWLGRLESIIAMGLVALLVCVVSRAGTLLDITLVRQETQRQELVSGNSRLHEASSGDKSKDKGK